MDKELKKLTNKQRLFCLNYVKTLNGYKSAIRAGYSKNTARFIASENLTKPYIKDYIDKILGEKEAALGISFETQLAKLKTIQDVSMSDLKNGWLELKEWNKIPDEHKEVIEVLDTIEETTTQNGTNGAPPIVTVTVKVRIKLISTIQATDMINKLLGYYKPERLHIGEDKDIDLSKLSTDELLLRLELEEKLKKNDRTD